MASKTCSDQSKSVYEEALENPILSEHGTNFVVWMESLYRELSDNKLGHCLGASGASDDEENISEEEKILRRKRFDKEQEDAKAIFIKRLHKNTIKKLFRGSLKNYKVSCILSRICRVFDPRFRVQQQRIFYSVADFQYNASLSIEQNLEDFDFCVGLMKLTNEGPSVGEDLQEVICRRFLEILPTEFANVHLVWSSLTDEARTYEILKRLVSSHLQSTAIFTRCTHCKKRGHSVSKCTKLQQPERRRVPSLCLHCGSRHHISEDCGKCRDPIPECMKQYPEFAKHLSFVVGGSSSPELPSLTSSSQESLNNVCEDVQSDVAEFGHETTNGGVVQCANLGATSADAVDSDSTEDEEFNQKSDVEPSPLSNSGHTSETTENNSESVIEEETMSPTNCETPTPTVMEAGPSGDEGKTTGKDEEMFNREHDVGGSEVSSGEPGHASNVDTRKADEGSSENQRKAKEVCAYCWTRGHSEAECRHALRERQDGKINFCEFCKRWGHPTSECRNLMYAKRERKLYCPFCRVYGHEVRDCTKLQYKTIIICESCGKRGHDAQVCRSSRSRSSSSARPSFCDFCGKRGHSEDVCRLALKRRDQKDRSVESNYEPEACEERKSTPPEFPGNYFSKGEDKTSKGYGFISSMDKAKGTARVFSLAQDFDGLEFDLSMLTFDKNEDITGRDVYYEARRTNNVWKILSIDFPLIKVDQDFLQSSLAMATCGPMLQVSANEMYPSFQSPSTSNGPQLQTSTINSKQTENYLSQNTSRSKSNDTTSAGEEPNKRKLLFKITDIEGGVISARSALRGNIKLNVDPTLVDAEGLCVDQYLEIAFCPKNNQ